MRQGDPNMAMALLASGSAAEHLMVPELASYTAGRTGGEGGSALEYGEFMRDVRVGDFRGCAWSEIKKSKTNKTVEMLAHANRHASHSGRNARIVLTIDP